MPQSTTAQNACDVVVSIDNETDTLTDVSGSSNQVDWTFTVGVGEHFNFGFKWPIRLVCSLDGTVSIIVNYTTTLDEGWDIVREWFFNAGGAARTVRWDTPDATAGSHRVTGEFVLQDMSSSLVAGEGQSIMVTMNLLPTGPVQFATIAS